MCGLAVVRFTLPGKSSPIFCYGDHYRMKIDFLAGPFATGRGFMGPRPASSGVKLADFPGRARCNGVPAFIRGEKSI